MEGSTSIIGRQRGEIVPYPSFKPPWRAPIKYFYYVDAKTEVEVAFISFRTFLPSAIVKP
jgi:hypothetical protein